MTQSTDIILNGDPYMLAPGKGRGGYTRTQDGASEGRTGRVVQVDFFGGTLRPYQLENDRGWHSTNAGPAWNGQGVQPWPHTASFAMTGSDPVHDPGWTYPSLALRDYVYFGLGQYLYRTAALSGGAWSTPTLVYDGGGGNTITGLCYYGGNMLVAFGGAKDITHLVYPNASSPAVLFPGERGTHLASYQGFALWDDQRSGWFPNTVRMVNGTGIDERWIDSPVTRISTAQADVIVASSAAVYAFRGRVAKVTIPDPGGTGVENVEIDRWTGDMNPYFQHGTAVAADDYRFILGFGGRTYAWVAKSVMEHDPQGERAGWRFAGLSGQACHGACVAAGYLVVAITTEAGRHELWAFDGAGWWQLANGESTVQYLQPIPLAGAGDWDVMVPRAGTRTMDLYRLVPRSPAVHAYPSATGQATYTTSLIDAGDRDKQKAWRKIGAVFASPREVGNEAATGTVNVRLNASTDAGHTWSNGPLLPLAGSSLATHNVTLERSLASDAAVSHFLMLQAEWQDVADWAPVLVGLWAEYEVLDSPARRRRWTFAVIARDQVIDRDGSTLTRTGRELVAELWQHWQDGTTVPFRDLDYDADATERRVRIVGIAEHVEAPHQAGLWGDSTVTLTLVEV